MIDLDSLNFSDAVNRKGVPDVPGIYVLRNKTNGKLYVGRSVRLKTRIKEHFGTEYHKTCGAKLKNAKDKYGVVGFEFAVIETCSLDVLLEREEFFMNLLSPFDDNGYNIRREGDIDLGSFVMSQEQKDKVSAGLKAHYAVNTNPFKGKTHTEASRSLIKANLRNSDGTLKSAKTMQSEEYKERISKVHKDRDAVAVLRSYIEQNGHPRNRAVLMLDKNTGEIIREFKSSKLAAEFLGKLRATNITNCLNKRSETAFGYKWSYKI